MLDDEDLKSFGFKLGDRKKLINAAKPEKENEVNQKSKKTLKNIRKYEFIEISYLKIINKAFLLIFGIRRKKCILLEKSKTDQIY